MLIKINPGFFSGSESKAKHFSFLEGHIFNVINEFEGNYMIQSDDDLINEKLAGYFPYQALMSKKIQFNIKKSECIIVLKNALDIILEK